MHVVVPIMFYSIAFAGTSSGDAPLKACWQLAHGRKLKKNALLQFSIPDAAKLISKPSVALSLRCAELLSAARMFKLHELLHWRARAPHAASNAHYARKK